MTARASSKRGLRAVKFSVETSIILLFLQILLGMWVNLFASFPNPTSGVNPIDLIFNEGPFPLTLHFFVGILLGVLSIALLAAAVVMKDRRFIVLGSAALGSVLLAGESGIEFVLGWYQENIYSYMMTVGFVLLVAVYVWAGRQMREWYPPAN